MPAWLQEHALMHFIYLHGFASSPQSSKAAFLSNRLAYHGFTLHCPDLNKPEFSTLTTTRMINQVREMIRRLPSAPIVLIGSSLGAFVALHVAGQAEPGTHSPIERLVLLAPAFDFGTNRMRELGDDGLTRWRERGWLEMEHQAYGERCRVHYELYADARQYSSFAVTVDIPTLIFQGRWDELVEPAMVERFAASRPHVKLVMLDDGHQLKENLDQIWSEIKVFLELGKA